MFENFRADHFCQNWRVTLEGHHLKLVGLSVHRGDILLGHMSPLLIFPFSSTKPLTWGLLTWNPDEIPALTEPLIYSNIFKLAQGKNDIRSHVLVNVKSTVVDQTQGKSCVAYIENCLSLASMLRCLIHILVNADPMSLVPPEKHIKTHKLQY